VSPPQPAAISEPEDPRTRPARTVVVGQWPNSRSASYRLDTPVPLTVARHWVRLPNERQTRRPPSAARNARLRRPRSDLSSAASPRRSRSLPTPTNERNEYRQNAAPAAWIRRRNAIRPGRCTVELPKKLVGVLHLHDTTLGTSDVGVGSRCFGNVATPSAARPAATSATETGLTWFPACANRSSRAPVANFARRHQHEADATRRLAAAELARPLDHMTSNRWCCHHRPTEAPRRSRRCARSGHLLRSRPPGEPGFRAPRRSSAYRPRQAGVDDLRPPRPVVISREYQVLSSSDQALSRGASMLPPTRDPRWA